MKEMLSDVPGQTITGYISESVSGLSEDVEKMLLSLGTTVTDREKLEALVNSRLLKSSSSIPEFGMNIETYLQQLGFLMKYSSKHIGAGEIIPLITIKGARSGGNVSKDIKVGSSLLEVKVLSGNLFATGVEGSIHGSRFSEHLETLLKYITSPEVGLPERFGSLTERVKIAFGKGEVGKTTLESLRDLVKVFNKPENIRRYIKVGLKRYEIEPGNIPEWDFDLDGDLRPINLKQLTHTEVFKHKLAIHPWVLNPDLITEDLDSILDSFLGGVDYLLLYEPEGKGANFLNPHKDSDRRMLSVSRVSRGGIQVKFSKLTT